METLISEQNNIKDNLNMDSLVDVDWLKANLGDPNLRVLECTAIVKQADNGSYSFHSGRQVWEEGHIQGSGFADLTTALSDVSNPFPFARPSVEQFSKEMGILGVGPGTKVVLYDRFNNMWATRVWWMLRAFGFDTVGVLDGGWRAWSEANYPVTTDESKYPKAEFKATPRKDMFVDTDKVLKALDDSNTLLIDSMSPKVYYGEFMRFARPGHIPGAVNLPTEGVVNIETMTFLNENELREHFAPILKNKEQYQQVIAYCGAGMRSTVNAFSLYRIGYKNVAVYDGSLNEWSANLSHPMTTLPE
jgi:thiosulfate/3-mercaptopyruvate sulfurtransferase